MAKAKKADVQVEKTPVQTAKEQVKKYEVVSSFTDKFNSSITYLQGAKIVESKEFDKERVADLLKRGLIK